MKKTIASGISSIKFNSIPLTNDAIEMQAIDASSSIELALANNQLLLQINLISNEFGINEFWEVGIENNVNSSKEWEPFGLEVISISKEQFLLRLCATKGEKQTEGLNEWLNITIVALFNSELPVQLQGTKNHFQL